MRTPYPRLRLFALLLLPLLLGSCQQVKELAGKITGEKAPAQEAPNAEKPAEEAAPGEAAPTGTIAMLVAHEGYQDNELDIPRRAFLDAGYTVEVLSFFGGTATGALGGEIKVDRLLEDVLDQVDGYVAVVLVGGPGAAFYHKEAKAHDLVKKAVEGGKVVGAICLAPFTLGYAGVLKGHKATAWTGGNYTPELLGKEGALFRDDPVVVDGKIVTANGPDAARAFARAILELLEKP
jgi:protease I